MLFLDAIMYYKCMYSRIKLYIALLLYCFNGIVFVDATVYYISNMRF